ncbi:MAG TPA: hypothetical protein VH539_07055 [Gemmatimonadaceae bacterium]|jgi:hypothetical protein
MRINLPHGSGSVLTGKGQHHQAASNPGTVGHRKPTKTEVLTQSAFHEVTHNPPKIVKNTRKKKGRSAAAKQRVAIALNKARAAGAHIPPA